MNQHERAYIRAQQGKFVARRYHFRGKRKTRAEVSYLTGWSKGAVANRIVGDTIEDRPLVSTADRHRLGAKRFVFRGEMLTVTEIVERTGRSRSWVYKHVSGNVILEENSLPPDQKAGTTLHFFRGERLYLTQWARRLGIPRATLYGRIYRGWSTERALIEPPVKPGQHVRNRKAIQRIVFSLRVERNAVLIRRIVTAVKKAIGVDRQTGGYRQTFDLTRRTGEDRHETHFEGSRA